MERGSWFWLEGRLNALKKSFMVDMHRMACGWAGRELPAAPMGIRPIDQGKPHLQFPTHSRQNLRWKGFVARLGH